MSVAGPSDSDHELCSRAIAYLKPRLDDDGPIDLELDADDSPIFLDLDNGLLVAYLVDQGDHFSYVQGRHLRGAKIAEDELHAIGLANLARQANGIARVVPYGDIFAVLAGGNFEASFLLLDDFWDDEFRACVAGTFAAVVPARDILAFGDLDSPAAVAQLEAVVARSREGPVDHLLIESMLTRVDRRWQRLP